MNTEKSTFRVLFYINRAKTTKTGESPILMRITVNGERAEVSTHRSIEKGFWNQQKGNATGNSALELTPY